MHSDHMRMSTPPPGHPCKAGCRPCAPPSCSMVWLVITGGANQVTSVRTQPGLQRVSQRETVGCFLGKGTRVDPFVHSGQSGPVPGEGEACEAGMCEGAGPAFKELLSWTSETPLDAETREGPGGVALCQPCRAEGSPPDSQPSFGPRVSKPQLMSLLNLGPSPWGLWLTLVPILGRSPQTWVEWMTGPESWN